MMSIGLVTGLLIAAISINMRSVECIIKAAETGTSKSEKIISVQVRDSKDIYPGTKWCGEGKVGANDNDLGSCEETDKCCKEYAGCEYSIPPGETNWYLTNTQNYTISYCVCDDTFQTCLQKARKSASASEEDRKAAKSILRQEFFNGGRKCMRPTSITKCVEQDSSGKCIKSEDDLSKAAFEMIWGK